MLVIRKIPGNVPHLSAEPPGRTCHAHSQFATPRPFTQLNASKLSVPQSEIGRQDNLSTPRYYLIGDYSAAPARQVRGVRQDLARPRQRADAGYDPLRRSYFVPPRVPARQASSNLSRPQPHALLPSHIALPLLRSSLPDSGSQLAHTGLGKPNASTTGTFTGRCPPSVLAARVTVPKRGIASPQASRGIASLSPSRRCRYAAGVTKGPSGMDGTPVTY